jgi:hypothetical protein
MDRTGIVHQDVEPALLALDLLEEGFDFLVVSMIDPNGNTSAAGLGDCPSCFVDGAGKVGIARYGSHLGLLSTIVRDAP